MNTFDPPADDEAADDLTGDEEAAAVEVVSGGRNRRAAVGLRAEILAALAAAGAKPLHRFGQNFMVDAVAVGTLVELAGAAPGVQIVEIGPGTGVLTKRLLAAGARVLAVEIDHGLSAWLTGAFPDLNLVTGDCLASKDRLHPAIEAVAAAGPWTLVSNLPYDVAIPVILNACSLPNPPRRIAVTVQWECAQRLASAPRSAAWGASAAVARAAGQVTIVRKLSPSSFMPRPRVDSAFVRLDPLRVLPPGFSTFVRALFAYRRKVLTRGLRDTGLDRDAAEAALATTGLDVQRRVEDLDSPELLALFHALPAHPSVPSPASEMTL